MYAPRQHRPVRRCLHQGTCLCLPIYRDASWKCKDFLCFLGSVCPVKKSSCVGLQTYLWTAGETAATIGNCNRVPAEDVAVRCDANRGASLASHAPHWVAVSSRHPLSAPPQASNRAPRHQKRQFSHRLKLQREGLRFWAGAFPPQRNTCCDLTQSRWYAWLDGTGSAEEQ